MALSEAEVRHVARLARIALSDEEIALMQAQLSAILDYIAMLQEVDVSNVPPTAQVTGLTTVWRPDVVGEMLTQEQALANAPDQQDGMFRVRAVFDE
ncbi:MAG TPA: Asp-tRNA(Asn)/Glu-tRNA(Gln) amidotransferase GatCAB subunit C [Chloroflexus aurantiacus]|jgi:aspartyl-tRNA(Asn)/glutamyl-tRNA(Gln) amidotransferase subunit C|uniref:Aspartyl/glutamyl-tRNA(Asn/Gln) amidotransferase subunit C n=2 Tax=Chloroflexus aurantiacus TaxID=1108 RepID=GATC_CHLAA|nr:MULTISPECIES: Asp-tRNA(Asn)/Glu-tRNA(Gln) amidotransferase subunit GatC [Chloroflexus]A9WA95.1 RecName: Full=Aspartyl/glutamyl-tRNA(Asn/Gln) amidotransferase subunit C; Short=Asp/Glu-ADT subunit C [Chloroflexus aurantiacus J-10-fl]B9LCU6.1 RecName: Full=Aspartyl/glutamyl-tRNA(Asn/Gln) amidotransferase subunit C; Short=Asp/Glu-ADT subunit C [Chloroflexus aurantiacus Y-400-fl]RMG52937.1 MAG: Asp-tRNA(Asn)/Glu-tRNA(Gln) amidotransferase GatCAB subunit C [Chloroflexota bacterium]ABY34654.1 gluta